MEEERSIEEVCIKTFGTLRPAGATPAVRSDNGLIFQSRRFRSACRDARLIHEFITPYRHEQNGIIERFFRSLKEECVSVLWVDFGGADHTAASTMKISSGKLRIQYSPSRLDPAAIISIAGMASYR
jgi:transposase InsO family protein